MASIVGDLDELQQNKTVVSEEGFDESLVGTQDEKKDNNELQPPGEEVESLKSETISPLIEDTELLTDKEPKLSIDTSEISCLFEYGKFSSQRCKIIPRTFFFSLFSKFKLMIYWPFK